MRGVCVIGADMIPFGRYPDKTIAELAGPAVRGAMRDGGVSKSDIHAAYCGTVFGGMMAGQRILKTMGMTGIPIHNLENACSSGATAFREAWIAIGAGVYDTALVIGVEKLTKLGRGTLPIEDDDWEGNQGLSMPALYAMRARRYMHEYGVRQEQLAAVAVKAHKHGAMNPYAQFQREYSLAEVMDSQPVAEPFTLLHCCAKGDGAAAVILCAVEQAARYTSYPVRVLASELTSGRYVTGFRDLTTPEISVRGAAEAYRMAALGPEDVDVAEVHDAFTIAELLYYEALGFAPKGEAIQLLESGGSSVGGRIPVNPSGGLLSKGHPLGCTGVAQMVEIDWQLRGLCGQRQVEGAKVGLTHCTGGGVSGLDHGACTIHVFTT